MNPTETVTRPSSARRLYDGAVTVLLWSYFTAGFAVCFAPFYFWACLFSKNTAQAFQRLNSRFYKGLFWIIRKTMPAHRWEISPEVAGLRGAVIVCNHVSYLDPILLIALYEKHKTIVKGRLFAIPIFGRVLSRSGYIPSPAGPRFAGRMIREIEGMDAFLADGGNLFIFPEGTRSRSGSLGALNPGAVKIARRCRTPIHVLRIQNTDRLYPPGRMSFSSLGPNRIALKRVGRVDTHTNGRARAPVEVMTAVCALLAPDSNESPA